MLSHPDAEVRLRATQALASLDTLSTAQRDALKNLTQDKDERIRCAALTVFPTAYSSAEPSAWVRYRIAQQVGGVSWQYSGAMTTFVTGNLDQQAWLNGVIQFEDDFLHQRFSWNDPNNKPKTHSRLRPPLIRPYGHPDRG